MKNTRNPLYTFAELAMSGAFHVGVNTGLIRMMRRVDPGAEFVFRGERKHLAACRERMPQMAISNRPLPFFPYPTTRTLLLRDLLGCLYVCSILCRSRCGDTLVLTNLLPFTHWTAYLLNRLLKRDLFIVLHGQMEAFLPNTPLRGTRRYFRMLGPIFRWDEQTHYVLLGETIHAAIRPVLGEARTIVIDHPYDYPEDFPEEVPEQTPYRIPLRLGQIGTGNSGKGTRHLFALAELLREEIESGRLEIVLTGALDRALKPYDNGLVKSFGRPLSETAFSEAVGTLHYALFLRHSDLGRAVPSGSFFDAVKYGKPYLSLDHPFVKHYHNRFPKSGIVCDSLKAMAQAIRQLLSTAEQGVREYRQRQQALQAMRQVLSPEAIAETFLKQLQR